MALFAFVCVPEILAAEIPLYQRGSHLRLDLGIRVQLQYYHLGGDDWSEEKLYFRRLRPTFEATLTPAWEAEAEFDFGETIEGEGVEYKDLFVSYQGLSSKGVSITVGNDKAVFSRQLQSSSKSLTLVERGIVGIDDFGSLDRVLGARAEVRDSAGRLSVAGSAGLASHEPDPSQMEFESPLNARGDANRGWSFSGRFELAPRGEVSYDQGDFGSEAVRFAVSAAAYRWDNDGSGSAGDFDLARAHGFEVGCALRGRGLSADLEAHWIRGEAVDRALESGLYRVGEAELEKLSLQSGYMVIPERFEVVGGYDRLDAATYASAWKRLVLGGTHYWRRQALKLQLNYILHRSFLGVHGENPRAFATQLQLVF
jgi:hypothetical protein